MAESIFLTGKDGSLTAASSTGYGSEAELQELLAGHLELLPGAHMTPEDPRRWLLIRREAGVPNRDGGPGWWAVDHFVVDQDATPTFIEVKRASDARSRREVVAQMLDYAANGSVFWTPEHLRSMYETSDPPGSARALADWLGSADENAEDTATAFWQLVGTNLREGRIRLIFVADEIPASLARLVEFLNEQMPRVEVLAVEIRRYHAEPTGAGAVVPRLIGQTSRAQAAKEPVAASRRSAPWSISEVMEAVEHAGQVAAAAASALVEWAQARQRSLRITGGTGSKDRTLNISGRIGQGTYCGVLSLYASPSGGRPLLEIRIREMISSPPFDRDAEARDRFKAGLRDLGIPSLDSENILDRTRPNLYLDEMTAAQVNRLLAFTDRWLAIIQPDDKADEIGGSELIAPRQPPYIAGTTQAGTAVREPHPGLR